jgi:hypothetical protein
MGVARTSRLAVDPGNIRQASTGKARYKEKFLHKLCDGSLEQNSGRIKNCEDCKGLQKGYAKHLGDRREKKRWRKYRKVDHADADTL